MTQICKFYGSGQCRFGQSCRFIHPRETTVLSSSGSSGFGNTLHGNTRQVGGGAAQAKLGDGFNLPTEDSIRADLTERPTWFLSSYAPGKDPPAQLIDGKDISPEEARVMAYKTAAEGYPSVYKVEWNRLTSQAETQIRNILNDLPGAVNFMKIAYENRGNSRYNSTNTTPLAFGSSSPQPSQFTIPEQSASAFAPLQPTSAFGKPSEPVSAFSKQSQSTASFGGVLPFPTRSTPAFGQHPFGQTPATPAFGHTAFSSAPVVQPLATFGPPVFGQSSVGQPAFGQRAFGQPAFGQSPPAQAVSPFGAPNTPTLGQITSQQTTTAFGQLAPFGTQNVPMSAFGQPSFGQSPFAQSLPLGTNSAASHAQQRLSAVSAGLGSTTNQNTAIKPNVFQQTARNVTAQDTTSPFSNINSFQQAQQTVGNRFRQAAQIEPVHLESAFNQPTDPVSTQQTFPLISHNALQLNQQQAVGHHVNSHLREQQKVKKWDDPVLRYMQGEIDAFGESIFRLGNVPTVAPSREMCWG